MSDTEQVEHKMCDLIPLRPTTMGAKFACTVCERSLTYTNKEILSNTPYKLNEVRFYLHHRHWEWVKKCENTECDYCD